MVTTWIIIRYFYYYLDFLKTVDGWAKLSTMIVEFVTYKSKMYNNNCENNKRGEVGDLLL